MTKKDAVMVKTELRRFVRLAHGIKPTFRKDSVSFWTSGRNGNISRFVRIIYSIPTKDYIVDVNLLIEPVKPGDVKTAINIANLNAAKEFLNAMLYIDHENEIIAEYAFPLCEFAYFKTDFPAFEKYCSYCEEVLYEEIY